jgi:hypothetical protein
MFGRALLEYVYRGGIFAVCFAQVCVLYALRKRKDFPMRLKTVAALILSSAVVSTLQATDAIVRFNGSCGTWVYQQVHLYKTFNYTGLPPSTVIKVRNAANEEQATSSGFTTNSTGAGSITQDHGIVTTPTSGLPLGVDTVMADAAATDAFYGTTHVSVSGGRALTVQPFSHACPAEATTTIDITLTYTITGTVDPCASSCGSTHGVKSLYVPPRMPVHTLSVKKNGTQIASAASVADNLVGQLVQLPDALSVCNGDTLQFYVDGNAQGPPFTVTFHNAGSVESPICLADDITFSTFVTPTIDAANNHGTPTPPPGASPGSQPVVTPVPANPTPNPNSTPMTTTTATPATVVINRGGGGNVNSSAVAVTNAHDIYGPIVDRLSRDAETRMRDVYDGTRNALKDAADDSSHNSITTAMSTPAPVDHSAADSDLANTKTKLHGYVTTTTDRISTFSDAMNPSGKLVFPNIGVHSYSWPIAFSFPLGSSTVPVSFNLDLSPYADWIEIFRNLCLFALYLYFWVATVHTIRSGVA